MIGITTVALVVGGSKVDVTVNAEVSKTVLVIVSLTTMVEPALTVV